MESPRYYLIYLFNKQINISFQVIDDNMKILAIIPARGGSKGIPNKNIKELNGKPLIAYTIENASESEFINQIVTSTENGVIGNFSIEYGAEVIIRPDELAGDKSPTINVIIHALNFLEKNGYLADLVVLLQPTSPLRTAKDIDNAIKLFLESECDSVVSVCEFGHSPYWSLRIDEGYLVPNFGYEYFMRRRQDMPLLYVPNGAIFISRPQNLKNSKSFFQGKVLPYIMPAERSIDIDNILDFKLAEVIIKERMENK